MRSRITLACVLLAFSVFLTGCQTTLVVHNANVKQIIQVFKDYSGMHGYAITFQNDQTGSYHLSMGTVFMPYTSSTQKSKSTISNNPPAGSDQPLTAYEQTSWNTVSNPSHYEEATAAVSIIQKDTDVQILIDTNDAGGSSLNDMKDYLQSLGYSVDNK
jgi:hypothetical protein